MATMLNVLIKIFRAINENGINCAEIGCESGIEPTYQCFFKNDKIIVLFQTYEYTNETLNHWGEHDNDFDNKSFNHSFFEISEIQIDQNSKRAITKDDYIALMVYFIERKQINEYEWGKNVVNSLHFNPINN